MRAAFCLVLVLVTSALGVDAAAPSQLPSNVELGSPDHTVLIPAALCIGSAGALANIQRGPTPSSRAGRAILGLLGAGVAIGIGAFERTDPEGLRGWGVVCMSVGGVSLGLAIRQAMPAKEPDREPVLIEAGLWRGDDGAPGLALRARF